MLALLHAMGLVCSVKGVWYAGPWVCLIARPMVLFDFSARVDMWTDAHLDTLLDGVEHAVEAAVDELEGQAARRVGESPVLELLERRDLVELKSELKLEVE